MEQLREGLRGAAQRDVAARRARRLRRRAAAMLALVLIGSGAAAQATNVFEDGPAAPDIRGQIPRYAPGQRRAAPDLAKLRVPGVRSRSASRSTRPPTAKRCALPGVVNGSSLGDLVRRAFRPYAADRVGTCNVAASGRRSIRRRSRARRRVRPRRAEDRTVVLLRRATFRSGRIARSCSSSHGERLKWTCGNRSERVDVVCGEMSTRSCSAEGSAAWPPQ
jgi:hypothetical protein